MGHTDIQSLLLAQNSHLLKVSREAPESATIKQLTLPALQLSPEPPGCPDHKSLLAPKPIWRDFPSCQPVLVISSAEDQDMLSLTVLISGTQLQNSQKQPCPGRERDPQQPGFASQESRKGWPPGLKEGNLGLWRVGSVEPVQEAQGRGGWGVQIAVLHPVSPQEPGVCARMPRGWALCPPGPHHFLHCIPSMRANTGNLNGWAKRPFLSTVVL